MSDTQTIQAEQSDNTQLVANVVAAYVSNNAVAVADLPALIQTIQESFRPQDTVLVEAPAEPLVPAVSIRKSITPDYIISLEDGRKFKSLKRHLKTAFNMTPEEYRAKWGLPKDYPMVAPNYAKARSDLAKQMGLGAGGRKATLTEAVATTRKGRKEKTQEAPAQAEATAEA